MKNLERLVNKLVELLQELPPDTPVIVIDSVDSDRQFRVHCAYVEEREGTKVVIIE